jgi:hypothetical protein
MKKFCIYNRQRVLFIPWHFVNHSPSLYMIYPTHGLQMTVFLSRELILSMVIQDPMLL